MIIAVEESSSSATNYKAVIMAEQTKIDWRNSKARFFSHFLAVPKFSTTRIFLHYAHVVFYNQELFSVDWVSVMLVRHRCLVLPKDLLHSSQHFTALPQISRNFPEIPHISPDFPKST